MASAKEQSFVGTGEKSKDGYSNHFPPSNFFANCNYKAKRRAQQKVRDNNCRRSNLGGGESGKEEDLVVMRLVRDAREIVIDRRVEEMRKLNREIEKRYAEVENDKRVAENHSFQEDDEAGSLEQEHKRDGDIASKSVTKSPENEFIAFFGRSNPNCESRQDISGSRDDGQHGFKMRGNRGGRGGGRGGYYRPWRGGNNSISRSIDDSHNNSHINKVEEFGHREFRGSFHGHQRGRGTKFLTVSASNSSRDVKIKGGHNLLIKVDLTSPPQSTPSSGSSSSCGYTGRSRDLQQYNKQQHYNHQPSTTILNEVSFKSESLRDVDQQKNSNEGKVSSQDHRLHLQNSRGSDRGSWSCRAPQRGGNWPRRFAQRDETGGFNASHSMTGDEPFKSGRGYRGQRRGRIFRGRNANRGRGGRGRGQESFDSGDIVSKRDEECHETDDHNSGSPKEEEKWDNYEDGSGGGFEGHGGECERSQDSCGVNYNDPIHNADESLHSKMLGVDESSTSFLPQNEKIEKTLKTLSCDYSKDETSTGDINSDISTFVSQENREKSSEKVVHMTDNKKMSSEQPNPVNTVANPDSKGQSSTNSNDANKELLPKQISAKSDDTCKELSSNPASTKSTDTYKELSLNPASTKSDDANKEVSLNLPSKKCDDTIEEMSLNPASTKNDDTIKEMSLNQASKKSDDTIKELSSNSVSTKSDDTDKELLSKQISARSDDTSKELSSSPASAKSADTNKELSLNPASTKSDDANKELSSNSASTKSDDTSKEVSLNPTSTKVDDINKELSSNSASTKSDDTSKEVSLNPTSTIGDDANKELSLKPASTKSYDKEVSLNPKSTKGDDANKELSLKPASTKSDDASKELSSIQTSEEIEDVKKGLSSNGTCTINASDIKERSGQIQQETNPSTGSTTSISTMVVSDSKDTSLPLVSNFSEVTKNNIESSSANDVPSDNKPQGSFKVDQIISGSETVKGEENIIEEKGSAV